MNSSALPAAPRSSAPLRSHTDGAGSGSLTTRPRSHTTRPHGRGSGSGALTFLPRSHAARPHPTRGRSSGVWLSHCAAGVARRPHTPALARCTLWLVRARPARSRTDGALALALAHGWGSGSGSLTAQTHAVRLQPNRRVLNPTWTRPSLRLHRAAATTAGSGSGVHAAAPLAPPLRVGTRMGRVVPTTDRANGRYARPTPGHPGPGRWAERDLR